MASAALIHGARVYWAWTSGLVAVSGRSSSEIFRAKYDWSEGNALPFAFGGQRLFATESAVVVAGPSMIQGLTEFRWHDAASGRLVTKVRCAEATVVCALAGRLVVFTRSVPTPESITEATERVDELGPEGALEVERSALAYKRSIYTNPEYDCVFGDGAVLSFDLSTGKALDPVSYGPRGEVLLEAHAVANRLVLAPAHPVEPWRSDVVRVHEASGGAAVWTRAGVLLAVGDDGVLLRDGDAVRWIGIDGVDRWSIARPTEQPDTRCVAIGAGLVCFMTPYDGAKTRPLALAAFDLATGAPRWTASVGKYAQLPVFDGDVAWVLDTQNKLAALSVTTGLVTTRLPAKDLRAVSASGGICAVMTKTRVYELSVYATDPSEVTLSDAPPIAPKPAIPASAPAVTPGQLLARLKAWFELFSRRPDIDVTEPLALGKGRKKVKGAYPPDAADFAREASALTFSYRLKSASPGTFDGGFLYLSLDGELDNVDLQIPGYGSVEEACPVDTDRQGTGLAAWYVFDEEGAFIVWSAEDPVRFASLTEYLTLGARHAFSYPAVWQRGGESPLVNASAAKSTPLSVLRTALIARGASGETADDLIAWLGADVALLLPR